MRILGENRMEDVEELVVFFQRRRRGRYFGSGPKAQLGCGWIGSKEGENMALLKRIRTRKNVLGIGVSQHYSQFMEMLTI